MAMEGGRGAGDRANRSIKFNWDAFNSSEAIECLHAYSRPQSPNLNEQKSERKKNGFIAFASNGIGINAHDTFMTSTDLYIHKFIYIYFLVLDASQFRLSILTNSNEIKTKRREEILITIISSRGGSAHTKMMHKIRLPVTFCA